ncbi:hypothetical protein SEGD1_048 [Enterobacteria phage SEGD1]|uniref:Uncharacterized protein n=1 Tax=Enterobacteria phage SEGD1 TaxID=1805456 RepID=A0A142IIA9_9CAUD|nr:hypothetical protein SEGD1_048 [Enterobacteria phage SEGD1]
MTHKVSLNNLVLDFKRTNEGKGVHAQRALTGLVAFSLAYNAVLADNGQYGAAEAAGTFLRPVMRNIVSDVNELYCVDLGVIEDMTVGLYCNRYCNVYGGAKAWKVSLFVKSSTRRSVKISGKPSVCGLAALWKWLVSTWQN